MYYEMKKTKTGNLTRYTLCYYDTQLIIIFIVLCTYNTFLMNFTCYLHVIYNV